MSAAVRAGTLALAVALTTSPHARAQPESGIGIGGGTSGGEGANQETAPTEAIFLCPGVGTAVRVLGSVGGGYCDFDFSRTPAGTGHIHCEFGGFSPVATTWNCWRVFPGQPDHPGHPDPDIIPDGWGVPWAILGPSPDDQWPPKGLAPAAELQAPPTPPPPPPLPAWMAPTLPPAPPPPPIAPWDTPTGPRPGP